MALRKMLDGVGINERRACRLVGLSRTSYGEPPKADAQTTMLSARIVELAHERRRFGYRRIHDLLLHRPVRGQLLEIAYVANGLSIVANAAL